MYELCCLKRAFDAPNLPALILKISKGNVQGPIPSQYTQTLTKLIDWMLATDPEERPNVIQVMAHHWVAPYVYQLPTSLGALPCISYNRSSTHDDSCLQGEEMSTSYLLGPKNNFHRASLHSFKGSSTNVKCIIVKASVGGMVLLPFPECELNGKIIQICSKNLALTDSGFVVKWRELVDKNSEEHGLANKEKIVSLPYDEYFNIKGIKVTLIASSSSFDCFITDRGILLTKGNGRFGCLAHGDRKSVIKPKIVEYFLGDEIKMISCSDHHVIAVNSKDEVFCWGQNVCNCLALNTLSEKDVGKIYCLPRKVSISKKGGSVSDVFCARGKSCILLKDRRTIYYAGNLYFNSAAQPYSSQFRCYIDTYEYPIQYISLTVASTIILYVDGSIRILRWGKYPWDSHITMTFQNILDPIMHKATLEKPRYIVSREVGNATNDKDAKVCVVIGTNLHNIYICKDISSFLMFISDTTGKVTQEKHIKNYEKCINHVSLKWDILSKFFAIVSFKDANKSIAKKETMLSASQISQTLSIQFYQNNLSEENISVFASFLLE